MVSRRKYLASIGTVSTIGISGCLFSQSESSDRVKYKIDFSDNMDKNNRFISTDINLVYPYYNSTKQPIEVSIDITNNQDNTIYIQLINGLFFEGSEESLHILSTDRNSISYDTNSQKWITEKNLVEKAEETENDNLKTIELESSKSLSQSVYLVADKRYTGPPPEISFESFVIGTSNEILHHNLAKSVDTKRTLSFQPTK